MMIGTCQDTVLQISKRILNTLVHQCIAVVFIYIIWVPIENYSNPFSWHVILSTLGILPFMIEALILFDSDNVWSQEISRKQKQWIHGILMFIGAFFIITGIALEINRKSQYDGITHFESAHAITGLIAMIFVIFAVMFGPMVLYTTVFSKWIRPVWLKLIHNILGQLAYILLVVCLCLGIYIRWFMYHTSESSRIAATVVTVLITLRSMYGPWKSILNQTKSILH